MKRDLRAYARQTNVRLAIGAFGLLFILGLGLIWLIYGPGAAGIGLLCLLGALIPIGLIFIFLYGIDWFVGHARPK